MPAISVRLPEEIETRLAEEARLGHRPRSEIVRQAIDDYLKRCEHERFMENLVREARTAYETTGIRKESTELIKEADDEQATGQPHAKDAGDENAERWWQ